MESTKQADEIPTALPGFEDEDAREKLLLETTESESDTETDEELADLLEQKGNPRPVRKRAWLIMRTVAGFAMFSGLLVLGVSWFFGMGWFAESKAQPVSRNVSKDPTSPVTEDEKLKMALSMVATNGSKPSETSADPVDPEGTSPAVQTSLQTAQPLTDIQSDIGMPGKASSGAGGSQYALPPASDIRKAKANEPEVLKPHSAKQETSAFAIPRTESSVDAAARSLFFGVTRKPPAHLDAERSSENTVSPIQIKEAPRREIPFGTLLPVRLVGSIYTLRGSGGFVRMELSRAVEGEGYYYPAGTTLIGNVRGGESARAFVTIVGLIDPNSQDLVKVNGELLGKDGASGIEGKRRRLTSQWARFFNGLKETASSVLGSVGALRSGGTVILSEPLRRGSESMSEDLSDALIGNGKDNTFIEVSAGATGYVLVTDLPSVSTGTAGELKGGSR